MLIEAGIDINQKGDSTSNNMTPFELAISVGNKMKLDWFRSHFWVT